MRRPRAPRAIEIARYVTTSLREVLLNISSRQGRRNLARGFNPSRGSVNVPTIDLYDFIEAKIRITISATTTAKKIFKALQGRVPAMVPVKPFTSTWNTRAP